VGEQLVDSRTVESNDHLSIYQDHWYTALTSKSYHLVGSRRVPADVVFDEGYAALLQIAFDLVAEATSWCREHFYTHWALSLSDLGSTMGPLAQEILTASAAG
jgi:hypothetical protein